MDRTGMRRMQKRREDNGGFSLLEVLVCIAVLALICVPVLRGFETSSWYNKRAYETQNITAYMQQLTETVQHVSKESFEQSVNAAGGSISRELNVAQQNKFPETNPGETYPEELFTVTTCLQEKVTIAGKSYDVKVVYDPVAYSEKKAAAVSALESGAEDINVYTAVDIASVDGMKFPVIADEINAYDGTKENASATEKDISAVLYNLLNRLTKNERSAAGLPEAELLKKLYENTGKEIQVRVRQYGNRIQVNCDIIYECTWPRTIREVYNVYQSNFELVQNQDERGNFVSWKKGGKIYILAKAWQEQGKLKASMPRYNKITFHNETDAATPPLELYLVRGYYYNLDGAGEVVNQRGLHFDEVSIDGSVYAKMSSPNVLTGEFSTGRTNLYTNIKGQMTGRQLMSGDFDAVIGRERARVRCYEVTMTLTDRSSGTVAARIVTTKEEMK